jgi:hypothetical protein
MLKKIFGHQAWLFKFLNIANWMLQYLVAIYITNFAVSM